MNPKELQTRLQNFEIRSVPLSGALPNKKIAGIIEDQLLRSRFCAAAGYRSACNAQSKKSLRIKSRIASEEIDEAIFWLEITEELQLMPLRKLSLIATIN